MNITIEQRHELFNIATQCKCHLTPLPEGKWRIQPAGTVLEWVVDTQDVVETLQRVRVNAKPTAVRSVTRHDIDTHFLGVAKEMRDATFEVASSRKLRVTPRRKNDDSDVAVVWELAKAPRGANRFVENLTFDTFAKLSDFLGVGTTFSHIRLSGLTLNAIRLKANGKELGDEEVMNEEWEWGWQLSGAGVKTKVFSTFEKVIDHFHAKAIPDAAAQYTPLHMAVMQGHDTVVLAELEKGSDINARDVLGRTPMHLACAAYDAAPIIKKPRYEAILQILMAKKADMTAMDRENQIPTYYLTNAPKCVTEHLRENSLEMEKAITARYKAELESSRTAFLAQKKRASVRVPRGTLQQAHQAA